MIENETYRETIHLEVNHRDTLKQIYIPFLKNGGLYIPCRSYDLQLNDLINLKIKLPESEFVEITVRVVWLISKEFQNPKRVGIEFCEPHHEILRNKIEKLLRE